MPGQGAVGDVAGPPEEGECNKCRRRDGGEEVGKGRPDSVEGRELGVGRSGQGGG